MLIGGTQLNRMDAIRQTCTGQGGKLRRRQRELSVGQRTQDTAKRAAVDGRLELTDPARVINSSSDRGVECDPVGCIDPRVVRQVCRDGWWRSIRGRTDDVCRELVRVARCIHGNHRQRIVVFRQSDIDENEAAVASRDGRCQNKRRRSGAIKRKLRQRFCLTDKGHLFQIGVEIVVAL